MDTSSSGKIRRVYGTSLNLLGKTDLGSREVVIELFGEELGTKLALVAGRGKEKDWRKILEPKNAVTQCEQVIGKTNGTPCYLCGLMIPVNVKTLYSTSHPLYAECEHILPVTSARWFLTLYMSKHQKEDPVFQQALSLEYAWAHRICNQTKSNDLFISEISGKDSYSAEANRHAIVKTLEKIQAKAQKNLTKYPEIAGISTMNIETRADTIIGKEIKSIIDFVNTQNAQKQWKGFQDLSRMAFMVDTSMMSDALQKVIQEYYEKSKSEEIQEFNEELQTELPDWLENYLPQYTSQNLLADLLDKLAYKVPYDKNTKTVLEKNLLPVFNELPNIMNTFITTYFKEIDILSIDKYVLEIISFYHYQLYLQLWNTTLKDKKLLSTPSLLCGLRFMLETLWVNLSRFNLSQPNRLSDTEIDAKCQLYDTKQRSAEAEKLTSASERVWLSILEKDNLNAKDYEFLVSFTQPQEFLEEGSLADLEQQLVSVNGDIIRLTDEINELTRQSASPVAINQKKKESSDLENERIRLVQQISLKKRQNPSESSMFGKARRKTRRAKLFPRTRLTHRSDRSKKLKTQSSRKSRKGKSKKTIRY